MASTRVRWHGAFKRCQPSPHSQRTDTRALSVVIACCFSLSLSLSLSLIALLFHRRGQSSFQPITRTGSILLGFDSSTISKVELVLERAHAGHTHTYGSGSATQFVVNVAVRECNISHSGNSGFKDLILPLQEPAQFDGSRHRSHPSDGG
jgi:hypothetical protein